MLAKAISPELSLSEQISVSDVKTIAELGFKSIICNRPDSEGPDQPTFEEIQATAEVLGSGSSLPTGDTGHGNG